MNFQKLRQGLRKMAGVADYSRMAPGHVVRIPAIGGGRLGGEDRAVDEPHVRSERVAEVCRHFLEGWLVPDAERIALGLIRRGALD